MKLFYGLTSQRQIVEISAAVCDCIGNGHWQQGEAVALLVETCAAETNLGTYKDHHAYKHGVGVAQCDLGTFEYLKKKYQRHLLAKKIFKSFGIVLKDIEYRELAHSPLLSLIFCRLRYYVVPDSIPVLREGRAKYWKMHYNTRAGKGTAEEYLLKVDMFNTKSLIKQLECEHATRAA
jgi:hypothetical protein